MTAQCLQPGNGNILVEIGANKFFLPQDLTINRTRTPGGKSASFTLELASTAGGPGVPNLGNVIGSDGKSLFRGLYIDESVKFDNNGETKSYSVKLNDFFSFTKRHVIKDYRNRLNFSGHISLAIQLATNFESTRPLNLLDVAFVQTFETTPDPTFERPDPFTIPYEFEFEGYLDDFLTRQCEMADCNWEIKAGNWQRIGSLSSGFIAIIIVRKNDIVAASAPKNPLFAPFSSGFKICPSEDQIEDLSLSVRGPTTTRVTVFGRNGNAFPVDVDPGLLNPLASFTDEETITYDLPVIDNPNSARRSYDYPENATSVKTVKITPNE